jgi:flagellar capping protein FliD
VRRLFVASGWSDNPKVIVGRWSNDTKSGTYSVNPFTGFLTNAGEDPQLAIPTLMSRSTATLASRSGNSKGLILNAPTDAGTANVTFSRGVADQIAQLYARVTNFADGALTSATKSTQNRITDISKQVDAQQTRVDNYKERLVKQYSAMEKSMQKVKGQSSSFMSQIGR